MQMTRAQYDQALDFATQPLEDNVARLTDRLRRRDAEIARLRRALASIRDRNFGVSGFSSEKINHEFNEMARSALNPQ